MPEYSFTIRPSDHMQVHCAALQDVSAALDHACRILRELSVNGCDLTSARTAG